MKQKDNVTPNYIRPVCGSTCLLTGQAVRLHLEVGDVLVALAVAVRAHASLPGRRGEGGAPLGVDLLGDGLQVTERRAVRRLGRGELGLPLVHAPLQLLRRETVSL